MADKEHQPKFKRDRKGKIDQITKVFFDLVAKKGYKNVSTNQVAKEAGVSIGTIYRYFPEGKAAIIREEFFKKSEEFISLSDTIKIVTSNDTKAVRHLVTKYLTSHKADFALHEAYDQALLENREIFAANTVNIREYVKFFLKKAEKTNPEVKSIPLESAQLAFQVGIDMMDHAVHQHLFYEPFFQTDEELIEYLVKLFQLTLDLYIFKTK
ncbi:MAG: TetR/AcrR family transcriptional regulator [Promethearchaeota archaeon]